jgi:ornithine cyclodeaminase/alanine dehydrogenase-like protein (mu-crystallin family)
MRKRAGRVLCGLIAPALVILLASSAQAASSVNSSPLLSTTPSSSPTSALPRPQDDLVTPSFQPGTSFAVASTWLTNALELRTEQLVTLANDITASSDLSTSDANNLTGIVTAAQQGVAALTTKVSNDQTFGAIRNDAAAMVLNFHVFSVITPEVLLNIAIDAENAAANRLKRVSDELAVAVATVEQAGYKLGDADALVRDLSNQLNVIAGALQGFPAQLFEDVGDFDNTLIDVTDASTASSAAQAALSAGQSDVRHVVQLLGSPSLSGSQKKAKP